MCHSGTHLIAVKNAILAGFGEVMKSRNASGDKACSSNAWESGY